MRNDALVLGLLALAGAALAGCGSATGGTHAPANLSRLTITGSSTVAPLAAEIGKRFETQHPEVRVEVQMGGSSRGIADARSGAAQIGMVSRALKAAESDVTATTIALDGVCPIVHRSNPIAALTNEQIVAIYTGRIRNWSDVGGKDAAIVVVNKAEGRSTLELFVDYFHLSTKGIRADVVIGDNQQGIKTVAGDERAIGYVSIGTAEFEAQRGAAIRLLPIGGVEPTVANVRLGRFPLSRPLNLVTREAPEGVVREFLDFARSAAVRDLVEEASFVPLP
jgi:phosphate transport system substrate-binding protein